MGGAPLTGKVFSTPERRTAGVAGGWLVIGLSRLIRLSMVDRLVQWTLRRALRRTADAAGW
jgi:hypothetical protein